MTGSTSLCADGGSTPGDRRAQAAAVVSHLLETPTPKDLLRRAVYWRAEILGYSAGGTLEFFADEADAQRFARWWIAQKVGKHPDDLTTEDLWPWLVTITPKVGIPPYPLTGPGSVIAYVDQASQQPPSAPPPPPAE